MNFKTVDIKEKMKIFEYKTPSIDKLLAFCTEYNCSDLYIKVGERPYISRYGSIFEIPSYGTDDKTWKEFASIAITSEMNFDYVHNKMCDFSYEIEVPDNSRFKKNHDYFRYRVNVGFSEQKKIATFRMITPDLPSFSTINFPKKEMQVLKEACSRRSGVTLLTGVTGSGKTTSLASCINDFTKKDEPLDNSVIITLEAPIEYLYKSTPSVKIVQKEMGKDFISFQEGVKQALREHPTDIVVGEIRDNEGINACIDAARTGHSIYSSFHTENVSGCLSRLYNYTSKDNSEIMYDLIANMNLILCQRLNANGKEFKLETQYMFFTDTIKKYLAMCLSKDENIGIAIDRLFENEELKKANILKDWS